MSDAQKLTIQNYLGLLRTNAAAWAVRSARQHGILQALENGQLEVEDIVAVCQLQVEPTRRLLEVLLALGVLEKYGQDFALSQAARLLHGVDADLGDEIFAETAKYLSDAQTSVSLEAHRRRLISRQWMHTASAIQAAEVLEIGKTRKSLRVLELGGGAGVWSAAMAYRDPTMHVTTVDEASWLKKSHETYSSVDLLSRWTAIECDYRTYEPELNQFDMVILPEILQLEEDHMASVLLGRSADALLGTGEVMIVEQLQERDGPSLALAIHSLEIGICHGSATLRNVVEIQRLLQGAGFGDAKWGWLTESSQGVGLMIAPRSPR